MASTCSKIYNSVVFKPETSGRQTYLPVSYVEVDINMSAMRQSMGTDSITHVKQSYLLDEIARDVQ